MRILLFGKNGQLASEIRKKINVISLGKKDFDLLNYKKINNLIEYYEPDFVINSSAYNLVDRAEIEKNQALILNGYAPQAMAKSCFKKKIPLVHFSTDYVFNGKSDKKYKTHDKTSPINWYGKTKLIGEKLIAKTNCNYNIIRTSWVFSNKKDNFVAKIIKNSKKGNLKVTFDEIGSPTPALQLADLTKLIIKSFKKNKFKRGIYHYTSYPCISRFDFAKIILKKINYKKSIFPISLNDINTLARRPKKSCLNSKKILKTYNFKQKKWINSLTISINNNYEK